MEMIITYKFVGTRNSFFIRDLKNSLSFLPNLKFKIYLICMDFKFWLQEFTKIDHTILD
jgi:hypothetical protein